MHPLDITIADTTNGPTTPPPPLRYSSSNPYTATMGKQARQRREKSANDIKLAHPDRSGPSEQTLLDFAQERNLFDQADRDPRNKNRIVDDSDDDEEEDGPKLSSTAERVMDTLLWVVSLSMGHSTFDFMVQYQYAQDIEIGAIAARTGQAFIRRSHSKLPRVFSF